MAKRKSKQVLRDIVDGSKDVSIRFADLCRLMRDLGFSERTRGSHFVYTRKRVQEIVNLQGSGGFAKRYQVRQVRRLIKEYGLEIEES